MHLLSWNVDQLGAATRIKTVADEIALTSPDIVTLQEVRSKNASSVAEALRACGLAHVWHSHDPPPCSDRDVKMGYHCVIASRWPVSDPPGGDAWRCSASFPEVLGRVTVDSPEGKVDVFTAHIPNGARYGWKKIETFETLALALRSAGDHPRVLTGDFNEPMRFLSSGQFLTFAETKVTADGAMAPPRGHRHGRPRADWSSGVRSVLADTSRHGLRDAFRDRHGFEVEAPVTHRVSKGGAPRCFDHTFVSRHFEVVGSGYHHAWQRLKCSDHSAMWTKLRLRTAVPPLDPWG